MNIGDVVQLRSGGPIMTVREITGEFAKCDWFDDKGNPSTRPFPIASLRPVDLDHAEVFDTLYSEA
jgi:uncharacterized protein YodC (DUF2158 family)